jgi:hypothetical protein
MPSDHRSLAAVRLVAPHAGLLPVQQIGQHRTVGDMGRRRDHRVDQLGAAVDAKMRLHPEVSREILFPRIQRLREQFGKPTTQLLTEQLGDIGLVIDNQDADAHVLLPAD